MLSKRKQLYRHKIEKVLRKYNAVLIYQHSGLTTIRWKELRETLAEMPKSASALSLPNEDVSVYQEGVCGRPEASVAVTFIRDKIAGISERLQIPSDSNQSLIGHTLQKTRKGERKQTMYQGPILLIACNSHQDMVSAHSAITKQAERHKYSVLLLGGSYYHATLNHKDVYRLISLNKSVYTSLLDAVESGPKTLTRHLVTGQHNLMALIRNASSEA